MKPQFVTADLAQETDQDQILALNRLEYGPGDILATSADFAWRYARNPAGQAIVPVIRDSASQVVGFIWVVPLRLRIKRQNYLAATGTNLVIQPEYRHTFAYPRLLRRFEQVFINQNIPLHFSFVSAQAYRQQRKVMPQHVSTIPLLVKPLNWTTLAQSYLDDGWQRVPVSWAGRLLSLFFFRPYRHPPDKRITLQQHDQFNDPFDDFWRKIQDKYPVMVIRDRAFLQWRFTPLSGRRYHIVTAWQEEQMLGYVVLRCAAIRGVNTGLVMDFLVIPGHLGRLAGRYLLAQAETYFRTQQMSLAIGLLPVATAEYQLLRYAGYIHLPQFIAPRQFRFAFFVHQHPNSHLASLSTQDWFITLADYEAF